MMGFTGLMILTPTHLTSTYDMNEYHDVMLLSLLSVPCFVFGISSSAFTPMPLMVTIFRLSCREFPID